MISKLFLVIESSLVKVINRRPLWILWSYLILTGLELLSPLHGVPLLFCTTSFPWLLRCHSRFSYFPGSSPPGTLAVPFHHPHNKFWSNSEMERLKPFLYIQPSQVFSSPMTLLILSTAMIPPFLPPDQSFRLSYGLIYRQLCLVI